MEPNDSNTTTNAIGSERLVGMIAAPHSPMDRQGAIHLDAIDQQFEHLCRQQVSGVFICGSTGECTSLSIEERLSICERWSSLCHAEPMHLIVHVGSNCQFDAIELAKHAADQKANAIAAFAPHYFKPSSTDALIQFLQPIAAAAGEVPFYFYDIPQLTHVEIGLESFLSSCVDAIPSTRGVKYTNPDLVQLQTCLKQFGDRFEFLFGCDEMLLAGLCLGLRGAVGSTYNFAAPIYHALMEAFDAGNMERARELQTIAGALVGLLAEFGFMQASKAVMGLVGVDCGPTRAPLCALDESSKSELLRRLTEGGFGEWLDFSKCATKS